ncbi:Stk1 family PASTA domain-containing Ser/Thr kinase [Spelaeicoccus albus]|uniref:non-specific serine/threonine protein kinase n=1 Tax=Spelaeicoccus albus TaxID=1280376 RepID=A0A7Z0D560_9MICO|nr:Stk1 family PASTA domain-containing Ser/Thr kinase [Spelaeicoccus albus]NYI69009.1 serine/threonine-protein kinase [Spelaeicoccus albus]
MTASVDPLIGRLIDQRYLVRGLVARGGMAVVYRAEDVRLDRDIALKVMHSHLSADGAFVHRFRREAKQAARLSHPHLTAVLDQGQDGDIVYLAMEYLPNITLRDRLKSGGPLTPREALRILDGVLQGLSVAHEAGMMHRDIKPENILLGHTGQVKLGDFGLARAVSASTTTSTLIGTVGYISPELVSGGVADVRSDIYSVGIMLYEMLTGVQPYRDELPIRVAYRHVHDTVPAPSDLVPGIAKGLDELVLWATAREPDHRPIDAAALLGEVRHVAETLGDEELDFYADRTGLEVEPQRTHALASSPDADGGDAPSAETQSRKTVSNRTVREPRGRKRRRGFGALLAGLIAVVLVLCAGGWYFLAGPGSTIPTPGGLVGHTRADADKTLHGAGLHADYTKKFSATYDKGTIVSTDPAAGDRVSKDGTVTMVVSKGPHMTDVPNVVGKKLDAAKDAVQSSNLSVGSITKKYNDSVSRGEVVSQGVKSGSSHPWHTTVDLTVSRGPVPVQIPDLDGQSADDAEKALHDQDLKVSTTRSYSDSVAEGSVISVSPESGTTVHHGDTVTLNVSLGPKQVKVPNVVGMQAAKAKKVLEAKGFTVKTEKVLGGYFNTVRGQDPAGGTKADNGSTITLTIV